MRIVVENEKTGRSISLYVKPDGRISRSSRLRTRDAIAPPGSDPQAGILGETRVHAPAEPGMRFEVTADDNGGALLRPAQKGAKA